MMRNSIAAVILLGTVLMLTARCKEDEAPPQRQYLTASIYYIPVGKNGDFKKIQLSLPWTATVDVPWLKVLPESGPGTMEVTIHVDPTDLHKERQGHAIFKADTLTLNLTFNQFAIPEGE